MESQRFTFQGSLVRRMSSQSFGRSVHPFNSWLKIIPFRGLFLTTHETFRRNSLEGSAKARQDQEKTASILFSRTAHLLDTYSILCTFIAHFPGGVDFAPVQFQHQCGNCTSAETAPSRALGRRCENYTEPSQSAGRLPVLEAVGLPQ